MSDYILLELWNENPRDEDLDGLDPFYHDRFYGTICCGDLSDHIWFCGASVRQAFGFGDDALSWVKAKIYADDAEDASGSIALRIEYEEGLMYLGLQASWVMDALDFGEDEFYWCDLTPKQQLTILKVFGPRIKEDAYGSAPPWNGWIEIVDYAVEKTTEQIEGDLADHEVSVRIEQGDY